MAESAVRALLFLDVDGPLIPFGAPEPDAGGRPEHHMPARLRQASRGNPLLGRLNPEHGRHQPAARPSPPAGARLARPDHDDEPGPVHWKIRGLVDWAAGRPFVWIDDGSVADKSQAGNRDLAVDPDTVAVLTAYRA